MLAAREHKIAALCTDPLIFLSPGVECEDVPMQNAPAPTPAYQRNTAAITGPFKFISSIALPDFIL